MYRRCFNVKNLKGSRVTTASSTSTLHLHLPCRYHGSDSHPSSSAETILIQWKQRDGSVIKTPGSIGSSLLNVAHQHDIDLEGACAGVCACSTCHVILEQNVYDELPEASEDEEDMLDQAFGLTGTSRLGCQICLEKKHDGMLVKLPQATRNFYVDGHKPKPH